MRNAESNHLFLKKQAFDFLSMRAIMVHFHFHLVQAKTVGKIICPIDCIDIYIDRSISISCSAASSLVT